MPKETFLAKIAGYGPGLKSQRVIIPDDVKERLETKTSQMVRVTINTDLSEESQ